MEDIALSVDSISKVVKSGQLEIEILHDISFKVERGKSMAVVGPSGCGKSTLLNIIAGLDIPTDGDVFWNGENISKLDEEKRASIRNGRLGFVFQDFHLIDHLTVLENVMLPLEITFGRGVKKTAEKQLEIVGLTDRINHMPKTLSGGEKQRVALARAFSTEPQFIFADEPTGSLDSANGTVIEDLLFRLNETNKTTLVIVTHDKDLASRCDSTLKLRAGRMCF
ncbi:ABC transporter ATP-binding protein [Betaproteobacteria bacterium]|nr:ABC transporter ATP-binding protein [Betaproteobacteria bacterium]